MSTFEIARNDFCPCGSGKKWKKCHDPKSGLARPAEPLLFSLDQRVDALLHAFSLNVLDCLGDVLAAIKVDDNERERAMQQLCLAFYGLKMYRITLAGITLIRWGQSQEAFAIKREQYFYWLALHYYEKQLDQAVLFVAYQPVLQLKKAEELASIDAKEAADDNKQKRLAELRRRAKAAYAQFPNLKRPRGKSGNTSRPVLVPWQEPRAIDMIRTLARDWVQEELAETGEVLDENAISKRIEDRARHTDFLHSDFPSQDKHGTAFALGQMFRSSDDLIRRPEIAVDNPNNLLYIYTAYPIGVISTLIRFNGLDQFQSRFKHIVEAFHQHNARYGE